MSTAIFLTPRGNGGYDIALGEDVHTRPPDGFANLIVIGRNSDTTAALGEGDWEQLRDRIDHMLNQR